MFQQSLLFPRYFLNIAYKPQIYNIFITKILYLYDLLSVICNYWYYICNKSSIIKFVSQINNNKPKQLLLLKFTLIRDN